MSGMTWGSAKTLLAARPADVLNLFPGGAVLPPAAEMIAFQLNLADRITLVERFLRRPGVNNTLDTFTASVAAAEMLAAMVANKDFEVLGTGASADDVTFDPEGGILLETDASASQQVIVLPHLSTNQSAWSAVKWGTDREVWWACAIKTAAALADVTWAGLKLTNTGVVATNDDQAFFRFASTGTIKAVYSIGGTDVSADTGVTPAVSTAYRLAIVIDASRIARFYIDGVLVATSTALTDAIDLIPYVGVEGNAKSITLRYEAISRNAA
jgi:hypothetical protein